MRPMILVLVLVSSLRLEDSKSRSRSRHWDFKIHSLGLDVETWILAVSVSKLEPWSRHSLVDTPHPLFWKFWSISPLHIYTTMWGETVIKFKEDLCNSITQYPHCEYIRLICALLFMIPRWKITKPSLGWAVPSSGSNWLDCWGLVNLKSWIPDLCYQFNLDIFNGGQLPWRSSSIFFKFQNYFELC